MLLLAVLIGAAILAAGVLIGSSIQPPYNQHNSATAADATQQADQSGREEWLGFTADGWVAICTFFLFVATAALFAATFALYLTTSRGIRAQTKLTRDAIKLTGDQLALARDEFNSTHRPKIRIKHVWLKNDIWKDERIVADLVVVNVGDTAAVIQQFSFASLVISKFDHLPNNYDSWKTLRVNDRLESGMTEISYGMSDNKILTDDDNAKIRDGRSSLYLIGIVDYVDAVSLQRPMKTAFCRRLMLPAQSEPGAVGRTSRFIRYDDPDYEYED